MDRIKSLYNVFSRYEQQFFKIYLSAFHNKGDNKALQLIEMVEKNPEISLETASHKLYADGKSKAFLMMKARVFEKMTEFLSLSISITTAEKEEIDPLNLALLEFRKSMLVAHTLRMRGLREMSRDFLARSLAIAKEISSPELEMDPLLRLKALNIKTTDPNVNNELFIELSDVLDRLETDLNAIAIFHHLQQQFMQKTGKEEERMAYIENHVPQLEEMLANKYSVRAEFYILNMNIHYFGVKEKYKECREAVLKLINLVNANRGLQNNERVSLPYFHLGILEALEGNYDAALPPLAKALKLAIEFPKVRNSIQLERLYILILNQNYKEAEKLIFDLQNPDGIYDKLMRTEKKAVVVYLDACLNYFLGKPRIAWQKMQNIEEHNFDKEGWNTGFRIFEIMLLVELQDTDFAFMKLENLRKHVAKFDVDPRSKAMFKLLLAMEKNGFSLEEIPNEMELVADISESKSWSYKGHELVRFDHWYLRVRGIKI